MILIFICYKLLSFLAFAICTVLIAMIFGSFAFLKINGRPFHFFVLNFAQTSSKPSLRVWNHKHELKDYEATKVDETTKAKEEIPKKPGLNTSRLNELSLVVDTKGVYQGEDSE